MKMPGVVFKFMTLNRYKLKKIIGLKDIAKNLSDFKILFK